MQFDYKTKQMRIDRIRYDADVFKLLYELLAPFAAAAAYARTAGITPDDAVVESLDRAEQLDLKAELEDMMKTHVSRLL